MIRFDSTMSDNTIPTTNLSSFPSFSQSLSVREREILVRLQNTNKRIIKNDLKNIPLEYNLPEINLGKYQPNILLMKHLSDDLFVGNDDAREIAKIYRVDFESLMDVKKHVVGFQPIKLVYELKGKFLKVVSNKYVVCQEETFTRSAIIGYFVFDWKTGKELFHIPHPPILTRILDFLAVYNNGYAIVYNNSKLGVINMMETKEDKFLQVDIKYSLAMPLGELFEATRNRLVALCYGIPIVFKWNNNELSEEYVIELDNIQRGCMIDQDTAAFYNKSPCMIHLYNLETRKVIKSIQLNVTNAYVNNITHMGWNSIIVFDGLFNCQTESKTLLYDNMAGYAPLYLHLREGTICENGNILFTFKVYGQKMAVFSSIDKVFVPFHKITELSKVALLKYSDVDIISKLNP